VHLVADRVGVRRLARFQLPYGLTFAGAVVGTAALAAYSSHAAPTGLRALDEAYVGALTAVVAYFAASARRWTWFLPAAGGAAVAADWRAALPAALAIALGFWVVATDNRTRARAALVAGLGVAALLRAEPVAFHGATALITAVAVTPILLSGYRLAGRRVRRYTRRALLATGGLVGLMLAGVAVGGISVAGDVVDGVRLLDEGVVAARDADDDEAALRLGEASRHLQTASGTLESWFVRPARGLPVVGPNLRAASRLADDVSEVASVTSDAATAVDVDALRFQGGRIDPELVGTVADNLETVANSLDRARHAVDDVQSPWLLAPVQERLEELQKQVNENSPDVTSAADGARVAHGLLGGGGPKRFLVLFTTPVETRGRTGFPGNYAELYVEDGRVTMPRFGRISELEEGGVPGDQRRISGPPDFLARYGRFDPAATWRNVVMSPDFPTISQVAAELYVQSGGAPIDGVLSVDPTGLAALMEFTGNIDPSEVPLLPEPLTPENTAEFLHRRQYELYPEDRDDRVDLLEDVAEITFQRLTSQVELPSPEEIVDILDPVVDGGHIQFTTIDVEYFDSIGLAGRFDQPLLGDFLSVVTSNAGGSKIDLFLQRHLQYDVSWDPTTGQVAAKVTATLHNAAPASGLPDYIIGNNVGLPWGTNRSFVSIYNNRYYSLDAARINGQPVALQAERELDRDVYSTFVDIPPGGTVTIELELRGSAADYYPLTLAQQPLVNPEQAQVSITVGGDQPIEVEDDQDVTVEGRTVRWTGPLDRERSFAITYDPD
jgi:hypothetical protein